MLLINYIKEKEQEALKQNLEKEAIKKLLIESCFKSYSNLIMNYNNEINSHYFNIVDPLINRYIKNKEPIQYILGYAYFYNLKLKVNKDVLIPRPETEILVQKALDEINKNHYKNVLDIGTGSGAIAIAIKKNVDVSVTAVDISSGALNVAIENAKEYNLDIDFKLSDLFSSVYDKYDVILSNPPYIDKSDINNIDEIVYLNEPHIALFSEDNGLYYYKEIINNLDNYLNKDGVAIMEVGYNQSEAINDYLKKQNKGYKIDVIKDYNNLDRVVVIRK